MLYLLSSRSKDIAKAAELIRKGELVIFPTETVYGLGGDGFSERAVQRIFVAKQRDPSVPLILHLYSQGQLAEVVSVVPEKARLLIRAFWPAPLTLVLNKAKGVPDNVTAGSPYVAVRQPAREDTLAFLRACGKPVAAPSANLFGGMSPTKPVHVPAKIRTAAAALLDGGETEKGLESTVLSLVGKRPRLIRYGAVAIEAIEDCIGDVEIGWADQAGGESRAVAELRTKTPFYIVADVPEHQLQESQVGYLAFQGVATGRDYTVVKVLSKEGILEEAARKLYAMLHELDSIGLDAIVADRFPEEGIGRAVNERLERMASYWQKRNQRSKVKNAVS